MRHLNYQDRIKIETLYREKYTTHEIAERLGFCERTIRNEVKRGLYDRMNKDLTCCLSYSADRAQADYNYKATAKGAPLKLASDFRFVRFCEACILKLGWSPDTIIRFIRTRGIRFDCQVCTKTLYSYIDMGLLMHVTNKHLFVKSKRKPKNKKSVIHIKVPLHRSITERHKVINYRAEFGHWEMDTVIGKQKEKPCLLVLTERLTRFEIVLKLKSKTQNEVVRVLNGLERKNKDFKNIFKTITVDNGGEFLNPELLEKSCFSNSKRTQVYYCHPYCSSERGSNENANKLIRRFIPKGQSMKQIKKQEITKTHNYNTANHLLELHNVAIAQLFILPFFILFWKVIVAFFKKGRNK